MNYHALKIDYAAEPGDAEHADDAYGAPLVEAHTCPKCGKTHARRQTLAPDDEQN
jgi:hypothetical protein